ncbi:MAG: alkyl hydroperoxide reductase subunit F [Propioniciclava sp.]|uniref:alkyl hydroperoxide reductase subunit F n=1 Tax=Propioniciclava sp. TaxID=2038686 RepID=UPI0039E4D782
MALDQNLAVQVKALLANIVHPIELVASLDGSAKSAELKGILEQIAAMSDAVSYREASGAERDARVPSFAIARIGTGISVRFAGIPLGHEFTSLVLALLQVGGHPSKAAVETLEQIASLEGEHHFETFFSLSCQNCPDVVQALNLMSIVNPSITHVAIDGAVFPAEAEERGVLAVPMVFHNGASFGSGRMTLEEIVGKLDAGAAERAAASLAQEAPFDVLVVGGGPAGATAAVYAARKGIRTGLLASRFGGQVLDTMAIENLISVPHTEGPRLASDLRRHVDAYDVTTITEQSAEHLIPAGDGRPFLGVELASGVTLSARSVIVATGARWRTMGVPGEDEYRNKGVTFCPHCDGPLFKGKRVAVIGGGNSGVEAAIDLAGIVEHVTVVEYMDALAADEVLQRKLRSLPNVEVVLGALTTEVVGDGSAVTGLEYLERASNERRMLDVQGVFVQIGLLPSTEWLQSSGLELSSRGEVVTDERGRTSIPGVFGAGDCTTSPYKQIVVAFGSGSTAALSAFDHLIRTSATDADESVSAGART